MHTHLSSATVASRLPSALKATDHTCIKHTHTHTRSTVWHKQSRPTVIKTNKQTGDRQISKNNQCKKVQASLPLTPEPSGRPARCPLNPGLSPALGPPTLSP